MIAKLADADIRPDSNRRATVGRDAPTDRPPRFADLLAAEPSGAPASGRLAVSAIPQPSDPTPMPTLTDTVARVFNQDGFFATDAVVVPLASLVASPGAKVAIATDHAEDVDVALPGAAPAGPTVSVLPDGRGITFASAEGVSVSPRSIATGAVRRGRPAFLPVIARAIPVSRAVPTDTTAPADAAGRTHAAPPRRPVTQGANVAVAVHAAPHGVEVAAQVAGLDDRERARLADEIAAMLSIHGYAPAHISIAGVTTPPTRQEHR